MIILGIDPGTQKAGFALIDGAGSERPLRQGVEPLDSLIERIRQLGTEYEIGAVALGHGTHAGTVAGMLERVGLPVHIVDERDTTLKARGLYFADHPPRGWKRLIPLGMQLPPRPVDDYAALLIARRYLQQLEKR
ncbi:MAG: pre-16S rRNA-processing nuclease YqgF [Candidatus Eremiobacteraeota bacterium]|nr:pre-16S rRNA-processing nuclease YqgF [Candidatus Eremiobacteraeota bacterium]